MADALLRHRDTAGSGSAQHDRTLTPSPEPAMQPPPSPADVAPPASPPVPPTPRKVQVGWRTQPRDIVRHIAAFEDGADLANFAQVNRMCRAITAQDRLWLPLLRRMRVSHGMLAEVEGEQPGRWRAEYQRLNHQRLCEEADDREDLHPSKATRMVYRVFEEYESCVVVWSALLLLCALVGDWYAAPIYRHLQTLASQNDKQIARWELTLHALLHWVIRWTMRGLLAYLATSFAIVYIKRYTAWGRTPGLLSARWPVHCHSAVSFLLRFHEDPARFLPPTSAAIVAVFFGLLVASGVLWSCRLSGQLPDASLWLLFGPLYAALLLPCLALRAGDTRSWLRLGNPDTRKALVLNLLVPLLLHLVPAHLLMISSGDEWRLWLLLPVPLICALLDGHLLQAKTFDYSVEEASRLLQASEGDTLRAQVRAALRKQFAAEAQEYTIKFLSFHSWSLLPHNLLLGGYCLTLLLRSALQAWRTWPQEGRRDPRWLLTRWYGQLARAWPAGLFAYDRIAHRQQRERRRQVRLQQHDQQAVQQQFQLQQLPQSPLPLHMQQLGEQVEALQQQIGPHEQQENGRRQQLERLWRLATGRTIEFD